MRQPITVWTTAMHQRRPYLELSDAGRAVAHIIRSGLFTGEIFNVVTENSTPDEIIGQIRRHVPELAIKLVDSPIMNQLSYHVSSDKFCNTGFTFQGSIAAGISDTIEWLKNSNSSSKL